MRPTAKTANTSDPLHSPVPLDVSHVQAGIRFLIAGALLASLAAGILAEGLEPEWAVAAQPNPRFADLPDGTALDLGSYECEARVPDMNCATIFDYSRINYDPFNHRILAFGGGHAATGRTDVDVFDLGSLRWRSLYPSMSCDEVAEEDLDPRGFHRKTGHPVARHTYDQNVIVEHEGRGRLLMFSTEGFSGRCHSYKATIRAVASLALDRQNVEWTYSKEMSTPWGYAGTAEFDPVSGMVILSGGQSGGMWVYDPHQERVVSSVRFTRAKNSSNLLYDRRGDHLYLFDRDSMTVRQYTLNRADWAKTREKIIPPRGKVPRPMRNLAYDSRNHIIGGVRDGVFHAFDLSTLAWSAQEIIPRSADGKTVGTVAHHAIDYDPVNNVFIFVTDRSSGRRTWAYRYRN